MKARWILWLLPLLLACAGHQAPGKATPVPEGMLLLPAGELHWAGEERTNGLPIASFLLDRTPVTVAQFGKFVRATGYVTEAEKAGSAGVLDPGKGEWTLVPGACWHHPLGRGKAPAGADYPVTQVSGRDAEAYCRWAGKRLPTVAEWEYAASGNGRVTTRYAWGDELVVNGRYAANVWQGKFPEKNTVADGYALAAPVGIFGKTTTGLTDMGGNVWQWTADSTATGDRVLKGGSFLCDSTTCNNYGIAGFTTSSPETGLFHIGFRCAKNIH
ncbi:SUMF1/EgtB/PvdO family nonheme iron enzyme [Paraflavisolibacter sp. H34]|uniref:SUMF1/EgtB/PvdO family nonheme iron enzyme n=1 Tax=Huijunlia imazamoxiresistens TaxID=3127457 RepID=UPI0030198FC7